MDPLLHLLVACAVFLLMHVLPSTPLRPALVRAVGEGPYLGLFSLASFAAIAWMWIAYRGAPLEPLWPGLRVLPSIVMPFALILIVGGVMKPNPTLVAQGGLLKSEEPARGLIRVTRHPIMWGIMLWAAAHLLARGELKSTIFFGSFLALAGIGTVLMDRRKAAKFGETWARFAQHTSHVPFVAIAQGRNRLAVREIGVVPVAIALVLYGAVFHFHAWIFGARPY